MHQAGTRPVQAAPCRQKAGELHTYTGKHGASTKISPYFYTLLAQKTELSRSCA